MGILDGGCDRRRRGSFGGELGSHCNDGNLLHSCVEVCDPMELLFGWSVGLAQTFMY